MPSQKGFSVIVLIVGVLILGLLLFAAFYFGRYTKKTEPASSGSDQVLYTPPAYLNFTHPSKGFSFEYPSNWSVKNEVGDIYAHSTDFTEGDHKMMNLTIIDSPLETVKSSYPQATEILVDTKKGLKDGDKILVPLGSSDSSVALFSFTNTVEIDHLISTIKFNEQASVDDPEHWPIYQDAKNGFSFPYPPIFKIEQSSGNNGVQLIYDNPAASGVEARIPPKVVLEAKLINTSDKADAYAGKELSLLLADPGYTNSFPGVTADQLGFKDAYKALIAPKNNPAQAIGYYFVNLKNSVLEIIVYYPNTATLKLNNSNILDSVVYKFKFQ